MFNRNKEQQREYKIMKKNFKKLIEKFFLPIFPQHQGAKIAKKQNEQHQLLKRHQQTFRKQTIQHKRQKNKFQSGVQQIPEEDDVDENGLGGSNAPPLHSLYCDAEFQQILENNIEFLQTDTIVHVIQLSYFQILNFLEKIIETELYILEGTSVGGGQSDQPMDFLHYKEKSIQTKAMIKEQKQILKFLKIERFYVFLFWTYGKTLAQGHQPQISSRDFIYKRCITSLKRLRQLIYSINYLVAVKKRKQMHACYCNIQKFLLQTLQMMIDTLSSIHVQQQSSRNTETRQTEGGGYSGQDPKHIILLKTLYGMADEMLSKNFLEQKKYNQRNVFDKDYVGPGGIQHGQADTISRNNLNNEGRAKNFDELIESLTEQLDEIDFLDDRYQIINEEGNNGDNFESALKQFGRQQQQSITMMLQDHLNQQQIGSLYNRVHRITNSQGNGLGAGSSFLEDQSGYKNPQRQYQSSGNVQQILNNRKMPISLEVEDLEGGNPDDDEEFLKSLGFKDPFHKNLLKGDEDSSIQKQQINQSNISDERLQMPKNQFMSSENIKQVDEILDRNPEFTQILGELLFSANNPFQEGFPFVTDTSFKRKFAKQISKAFRKKSTMRFILEDEDQNEQKSIINGIYKDDEDDELAPIDIFTLLEQLDQLQKAQKALLNHKNNQSQSQSNIFKQIGHNQSLISFIGNQNQNQTNQQFDLMLDSMRFEQLVNSDFSFSKRFSDDKIEEKYTAIIKQRRQNLFKNLKANGNDLFMSMESEHFNHVPMFGGGQGNESMSSMSRLNSNNFPTHNKKMVGQGVTNQYFDQIEDNLNPYKKKRKTQLSNGNTGNSSTYWRRFSSSIDQSVKGSLKNHNFHSASLSANRRMSLSNARRAFGFGARLGGFGSGLGLLDHESIDEQGEFSNLLSLAGGRNSNGTFLKKRSATIHIRPNKEVVGASGGGGTTDSQGVIGHQQSDTRSKGPWNGQKSSNGGASAYFAKNTTNSQSQSLGASGMIGVKNNNAFRGNQMSFMNDNNYF